MIKDLTGYVIWTRLKVKKETTEEQHWETLSNTDDFSSVPEALMPAQLNLKPNMGNKQLAT